MYTGTIAKITAAALVSVAAAVGGLLYFNPTPEPVELVSVTPKPILYGDDVRVRLYRGLGGRAFDHATDRIGLDAHKQCGVRYYVESQQGLDDAALAPGSAVRRAKRVILFGTSMGGEKARDMAEALAPLPVDLYLLDTVSWTKPIPPNVDRQITWRNTMWFQPGGGRPEGTKDDRPFGPWQGHLGVIHSQRAHDEAVNAICNGVTHPSQRPE